MIHQEFRDLGAALAKVFPLCKDGESLAYWCTNLDPSEDDAIDKLVNLEIGYENAGGRFTTDISISRDASSGVIDYVTVEGVRYYKPPF